MFFLCILGFTNSSRLWNSMYLLTLMCLTDFYPWNLCEFINIFYLKINQNLTHNFLFSVHGHTIEKRITNNGLLTELRLSKFMFNQLVNNLVNM